MSIETELSYIKQLWSILLTCIDEVAQLLLQHPITSLSLTVGLGMIAQ